jgi:N-acetylglucosamine kinase-like BadF-type ATPase
MADKSTRARSYQLFLGVDGGGTKTNAVLTNERDELVGEGSGGASNPLRVGVETAVGNIAAAIDAVCDKAGVSRGDVAAATLGLAGVRRQDLRERVRDSFIARLRIRQTTVTTDADIALYGTTLGDAGLVVIAGTGSVCLGVDGKGNRAMSGGWGPIAGDEGGGRGIAGEALHAVAKASDGRGEQTRLSERAAEYFRAASVENLITAIYAPQMDNSRIAGFAKCVVETALEGDEVARRILEDAGRELGVAACAVLQKLGLETQKIPIGCVGSIFEGGSVLTEPMSRRIAECSTTAYLTEPRFSPANAAALMARRESGRV